MVQTVGEPHPTQHAGRFFGGHRHRLAGDEQRHGGIFQRAELGEQVVKLINEPQLAVAKSRLGTAVPAVNILPLEQHSTAGGVVERAHQMQQGGLARPRAAHHRQHLAGCNTEINPLEDLGLQLALFIDMVEGLATQQRLTGQGFIHKRGSTYTSSDIGTSNNIDTSDHTGSNNRR